MYRTRQPVSYKVLDLKWAIYQRNAGLAPERRKESGDSVRKVCLSQKTAQWYHTGAEDWRWFRWYSSNKNCNNLQEWWGKMKIYSKGIIGICKPYKKVLSRFLWQYGPAASTGTSMRGGGSIPLDVHVSSWCGLLQPQRRCFKAIGDRCIVLLDEQLCHWWLREDHWGQTRGGLRVSSKDWTDGIDSRALPMVPPAR